MTDSEIRATFKDVFNGQPNFMTPSRLAFGKKGKFVWELSTGPGIARNSRIWGVTVIELPRTHRHNLGGCFDTYEGAQRHIANHFHKESENV